MLKDHLTLATIIEATKIYQIQMKLKMTETRAHYALTIFKCTSQNSNSNVQQQIRFNGY